MSYYPQENERLSLFARVRNWYGKFERPISSLSLIGGFVFDALTLTRVDEFWENFWVAGHLLIVAVCIFLINLKENENKNEVENPDRAHFWLVNILQFFFGGLLSTFLVFYFRSGTLGASWPFFAILAAAFIANESLKRHYTRLAFQISLFFLSLYLFAIYLVPILFHEIGPWIFVLSGVISLVTLWIFLQLLKYSSREKFSRSRVPLFLSILAIFTAMNALYFFNLIPPIPLSLKDGGVYRSLVVNGPGHYTVESDDQGFFGFLQLESTVHINAGSPLYAYSAIFSPAEFDTTIVHEWQFYNASTSKWTTASTVTLGVIGGSDGGYRTFSIQGDVQKSGKWRVNVETTRGQVIGRLDFNVVLTSTTPTFITPQI
jgi:MFS family permease